MQRKSDKKELLAKSLQPMKQCMLFAVPRSLIFSYSSPGTQRGSIDQVLEYNGWEEVMSEVIWRNLS